MKNLVDLVQQARRDDPEPRPRDRRKRCANGCGRMVGKGANDVCEPCKRNAPLPRPRVELMPDSYLLEAVEELRRRRDKLTSILDHGGNTK